MREIWRSVDKACGGSAWSVVAANEGGHVLPASLQAPAAPVPLVAVLDAEGTVSEEYGDGKNADEMGGGGSGGGAGVAQQLRGELEQTQLHQLETRKALVRALEEEAEAERAPTLKERRRKNLDAVEALAREQRAELETKRAEVAEARARVEAAVREREVHARDAEAAGGVSQPSNAKAGTIWEEALLRRRAEMASMHSRRLREQVFVKAQQGPSDSIKSQQEKLRHLRTLNSKLASIKAS